MIPSALLPRPDLTYLTTTLARMSTRCEHGFDRDHQTCPTCVPVAPTSEWAIFTAALRESVDADGLIHQSAMRRRIRGRVSPPRIGQFYRRARAEHLIEDTGDREPSDDAAGRNGDKLDRIYAWRGTAVIAA